MVVVVMLVVLVVMVVICVYLYLIIKIQIVQSYDIFHLNILGLLNFKELREKDRTTQGVGTGLYISLLWKPQKFQLKIETKVKQLTNMPHFSHSPKDTTAFI